MARMIATKSRVFRFADVTVREREFAIVKAGQVQQVEPKAFRVLLVLIRNPNRLIAKEELLNAVWGDAAVTENSLARNIALLRRMLGDDPRAPSFIETVSSVGYRFVCPVEVSDELDASPAEQHESAAIVPNGHLTPAVHGEIRENPAERRSPVLFTLAGVLILLAAVSILAVLETHRTPPPRDAWQQITNFPDSATSPALSPDGRMLVFVRGPNWFMSSGQIYVKLLPDGEPVQLTHDDLLKGSPAFSPDGSSIAYTTADTTFEFNSWIVPVLKGEPRKFLPNAGSLTWIDHDHVMFSEIKQGSHMGIVTASESRAAERDVYLPVPSLGMAHRSWISPDHKWVLVSEMDDGHWLPCRLVPFDGSSRGNAVGPRDAPCVSAAWSPDGRTMYFSANAGDGYHLWRQQFPAGVPERLTSGATEEEGLAVSPDGRWLVTSAGVEQRTVWVHDSRGDRQVSGEGFASLPGLGAHNHPWVGSVFSPDGKRLFYLLAQRVPPHISGQLWVADLDSGRTAAVFPDIRMTDFDIAPDGRRVAFETEDQSGVRHAWVAPLDRSSPPKLLTAAVALEPHFGTSGDIYMIVPDGGQTFLYKAGSDGIARKLGATAADFIALSPGGDWFIQGFDPVRAIPVRGGSPVPLCHCGIVWGSDGKTLYLRLHLFGAMDGSKTIALGLPPGKEFPNLPSWGLDSGQHLKGINVLADINTNDKRDFSPGPNPSIYAYDKGTTLRNVFRIPLN